MNKLRQEALELLSSAETFRPAVLRRSLRNDAMYATDLPRIADNETVAGFLQKAEESGWHAEMENGWIHLDRVPESMSEGCFQGPYGLDAECCLSILARHTAEEKTDGKSERRMLL